MNLLFRASAGTGKTWQISSFYTALALGRPCEAIDAGDRSVPLTRPGPLEPIPPDRILLMTFTDNAAAELRLRVTRRMLEARQEAVVSGTPEKADLAARVLRALPGAPICTIHAFCADLLRERALDAGLSPAFTILDAEAADRLLEETARKELLARLDRKPAAGAPAGSMRILKLLPRHARPRRNVQHHGPAGRPALLRQAASKGLDLARAEDWLPPPRQTVTHADFEAILEDLRRSRAARGGKLPERAAHVFQSLEKNLKIFPMIGKESAIEELAAALEREDALTCSGKELNDISRKLKRRGAKRTADGGVQDT